MLNVQCICIDTLAVYTAGAGKQGIEQLSGSVQIIVGGGLLDQWSWGKAIFASIFIIAVHLTAMEEVTSIATG